MEQLHSHGVDLFSSHAVQIEVTNSLNVDSFIFTFHRFIARRGAVYAI